MSSEQREHILGAFFIIKYASQFTLALSSNFCNHCDLCLFFLARPWDHRGDRMDNLAFFVFFIIVYELS